ncbi:MAG: ISNCY family transposase [Treponema sp.]|nr:ISNCY family transposase [Treponema sp.]
MKDKRKILQYLKKCVDGKITITQFAEATGYSYRHCQNLKKRYIEEGADCLIHGNTNKKSSRRISDELRQKVCELYLKEYDGYNFTFFNEILSSDYDINLGYRSLYNILTESGIKSPEKHKVKKTEKHHRIRARRMNEGDLVQIDGTPFQWFLWCGDKNYYCIHAGVDDATSKIVGMFMTENECLYGYMGMIKSMYRKYGLPNSFYSDRASIFCVTPRQKDKLSILEQLQGVHEKRTQFQRIMDELHINQILAWSPQAKGRVERMWQTVQSRLPHYFKKHQIKTIEEANLFMEKFFVDIYNEQFGKQPADDDSFFMRYFQPDELDKILCARFPCKTDHNGQFKFRGMTFAVIGAKYSACKPIEMCVTEKGISACLNGEYYQVRPVDELTDGYDELIPKVVRNIIHDALMKNMKKESA